MKRSSLTSLTASGSGRASRFLLLFFAAASLMVGLSGRGRAQGIGPHAEALLYCTMPSRAAHSPQMAMDGDRNTFFHSVYGMGDHDEFLVLLSESIPVRSIHVLTGHENGRDGLTGAVVEVSPRGADAASFRQSTHFDLSGAADFQLNGQPVGAIRIRLDHGAHVPSLVIREITIDSRVPVTHAQYGPGRGFHDVSQATDVFEWSQRAEAKMEAFWPDTAALLYSDGFITPNMVRVVYRTGPGVTGVAATGGGEMEVNANWCRQHPEDTGLTVHEDAHVVQSMSAYDPVWLIEGTADYVRWIKFEPQNFTYRIDPAKSTYHDSYRTTAAFLAYCELHYDSKLVTKLNNATRYGNFKIEMFQQYCGKDVDTLWSEFVAAYQADPVHVITTPVAIADQPRELPAVSALGSKQSVDLGSAFDTLGFRKDSAKIENGSGGFDGEGFTYSSKLLGTYQSSNGVEFKLGKADTLNTVACKGQTIALPEQARRSIWLLGSAVEGSKRGVPLIVTYTDGSTETLSQNFSDWYEPQDFPGETRAVTMAYRVGPEGLGDHRTFYLYSYGFPLNKSKTLKSLTLPNEPYLKFMAITLAN